MGRRGHSGGPPLGERREKIENEWTLDDGDYDEKTKLKKNLEKNPYRPKMSLASLTTATSCFGSPRDLVLSPIEAVSVHLNTLGPSIITSNGLLSLDGLEAAMMFVLGLCCGQVSCFYAWSICCPQGYRMNPSKNGRD